MQGLMQDVPLTLPHLFGRAASAQSVSSANWA